MGKKNKKTFSDRAKAIQDKYKRSSTDPIERVDMNRELKALRDEQEAYKQNNQIGEFDPKNQPSGEQIQAQTQQQVQQPEQVIPQQPMQQYARGGFKSYGIPPYNQEAYGKGAWDFTDMNSYWNRDNSFTPNIPYTGSGSAARKMLSLDNNIPNPYNFDGFQRRENNLSPPYMNTITPMNTNNPNSSGTWDNTITNMDTSTPSSGYFGMGNPNLDLSGSQEMDPFDFNDDVEDVGLSNRQANRLEKRMTKQNEDYIKTLPNSYKSMNNKAYTQGLIGLGAGILGNLPGLLGKYDTKAVESEMYTPETISLAREREIANRQADRSKNVIAHNIGQSGTGNYLSNLAASNVSVDSQLGDQLARSYQTEETTNADIINRAKMYNSQTQSQNDRLNFEIEKANKMNKANAIQGMVGSALNYGQGILQGDADARKYNSYISADGYKTVLDNKGNYVPLFAGEGHGDYYYDGEYYE